MDIIDMYVTGMVTPLDALTLLKPYLIIFMVPIKAGEDHHLLVRLRDERYLGAGQNIHVILPEGYTSKFGPAQLTGINNSTLSYKLIMLGFSLHGQPVPQFQHVDGTVV
jgi:hypothetical protein